MIKNIVSCGCSWVYGSGCIPQYHRVSTLFAKKYNAEDINLAKDGGNNDRSVRKIVDWAIQNKDKLDETIFLLGLSSVERYELWDEQRGYYAGGCYDIHRPDNPRRQESEDSIHFLSGRTEKFMAKYHYNTLRDYDRTFRNVLYLMGVLDSLNCKYLVFDCISWTRPNLPSREDYVGEDINWEYDEYIAYISEENPWEYDEYIEILLYIIDNPLYQEILTHKNFYSKQCWAEFCSPRGKGMFAAEDERSPHPPDGRFDWGHPSAKGNQKWFEVLTNYAEKNKLWDILVK